MSLFLGLPSTFWNFDGVACAAALELGRPDYFFHANHLLYGFLGYLFWRFLCAPLGIARALPALQLFSSLLSAVGLIGLYHLFSGILADKRVALGLMLGVSVTAAFWVWSIEAQVYPLGFVALAWATVVLLGPSSRHKYLWVGLLHGAAVLGHQMHVLWLFPVLYWMRREDNVQSEQRWQYIGSLTATTVIPYILVLTFVVAPGRDLNHVLIWLKGSAGLTPDRHWAWHFPGWTGPWIWLKSTAPALWGSFWPYGRTTVGPGLWTMTLLSCGVLLFLWIRAWSKSSKKDLSLTRFALVWIVAYGLFLSTWEPATLCYRMTDILPWGILMAVGLKDMRLGTQGILLSLLLATTLTVNGLTRIGPMSRPEENTLYQDTLTLSKITPSDSLYITEGGMAWLYLLYFAGRTAWNRQSWDPQKLSEIITRQKKIRPVYIQKGSVWEPAR